MDLLRGFQVSQIQASWPQRILLSLGAVRNLSESISQESPEKQNYGCVCACACVWGGLFQRLSAGRIPFSVEFHLCSSKAFD